MSRSIRGVVLAGGTGSRLYPLTKVTNKHLLPVGRVPMIYHPVRKLIDAGVHEILIVTGTEHMGDVVSLLGSGKEFGCEFTYRVQDEAGGIAQALGLARTFATGSKLLVILGDNIFTAPLGSYVERFRTIDNGAMVLLKEVPDPWRYGVARFDCEKIVEIVEKPKTPPSSMAVTGIYFYDQNVFDVIAKLNPSARGELEITDVNNAYIDHQNLHHDILPGEWTDAGTFESWGIANSIVR